MRRRWGGSGHDDAALCGEPRGPEDFIVVQAREGVRDWESVDRVASVGDASIFTRVLTPVDDTSARWELQLEDDRLIQVNSNGAATLLVTCGG